jgi:curved DNA-binding protein CbpA
VPIDSPERPKRTKKFQAINDAYYTLSNAERRKLYDQARSYGTTAPPESYDDEDDDHDGEVPRPNTKHPFDAWAWFTGSDKARAEASKAANDGFSPIFEEMMGDAGFAEGKASVPNRRFWGIVGAVAGASLGFIVGNLVGAGTGAVAGSYLGGIRDKSGMSVYAVFQELDQGSRARILTELATKLFASVLSG